MRHLFRSPAMLIAGLALLIAGSAVAQTTPANQTATAAPPDASTAGEVVVTATKRSEQVRKVPATITAVTGAQLTATGPVDSTGDLLRTVPGVRFNDLASPNLSEISIRGSGTERATGADSGVGLFVNGAYVGSSTLGGRNFMNLDFFDVDRVEVLEGPQGALYGRNAEYGEVNIITAKPAFDDSGYVNESYTGKLGENQLMAVENHTLGDDWALRLGVESISQTGGFDFNPDSGKYYDSTSGWIARGQLRYRHGPLDVDFLVDGQNLNLPTFDTVYDLAPGKVATLPLGYFGDRYVSPHDGLDGVNQQVGRGMLLINYDLGWAQLSSTTMVDHWTSTQNFASAFDLATEAQFQKLGEVGAYPLGQTGTIAKDNTVYEDLHLAGAALDNNLNWLVGAEVLDQQDDNGLYNATSPCVLKAGAGVCGGTPTTHLCYLLLPTSTPCPTVYPAGFGAVSDEPERYLSEAVYGSLKYRIRSFSLTGELRYTNDNKKANETVDALYTGVQTQKPSSFTFDADRINYTVTAAYDLPGAWHDLIYAKVGTGYRAGGVNAGTSSPFAPTPFQPNYGDEDTISYEGGIKGNLTRFVYFTLDYYTSQTNNAITSINDGCTILNACGQGATVFNINGGTVRAHGVELAVDSTFNLAGGVLSLSLSGANQYAKFVSVPTKYVGLPILNSPVAQIPAWTGSATVDYRHPLTDSLTGFIHVVYSGQQGGGQDTVTSTTPFVSLDRLNDVSLRTGLDYKKLEAALFIQNLTNETVQLLKLEVVGIPYAVRYNEPRTFGVNLIYRW